MWPIYTYIILFFLFLFCIVKIFTHNQKNKIRKCHWLWEPISHKYHVDEKMDDIVMLIMDEKVGWDGMGGGGRKGWKKVPCDDEVWNELTCLSLAKIHVQTQDLLLIITSSLTSVVDSSQLDFWVRVWSVESSQLDFWVRVWSVDSSQLDFWIRVWWLD
jgi:hypothetical protein